MATVATTTLHLVTILRHYANSLIEGHQFIFQSLPRMLTVWFEFMEEAGGKTRSSRSSKDCSEMQKTVEETSEYMKQLVGVLKAYQWFTALPQIISRFNHPHPNVTAFIQEVIASVLKEYPQQALWTVATIYNSTKVERRNKARKMLRYAVRDDPPSKAMIVDNLRVFELLIKVCNTKIPKNQGNVVRMSRRFEELKRLRHTKVLIPIQSNLTAVLPANGRSQDNYNAFPSASVTILEFEDEIEVMPSKERPMKIKMMGSDGQRYLFLCKREERGDMRKNSRLMEFNTVVNRLLLNTPESRKRNLKLRTFAVLPLTEECGLIEWVNHTCCFRHVVHELHMEDGIFFVFRSDMKAWNKRPSNKLQVFRQFCRKYPAVFHRWFYRGFAEPTAWFESRLRYVRSVAVWSMVGYVVGLGDRHGENILLDKLSGEVVHVDFDCLFDRGKTLEIPERVPFRLTQNVVDGFGVTGCSGTFQRSCESILGVLRDHKDALMNVLYSFVHDPLVEWKEKKSDRNARAKVIMNSIETRLRGQLNKEPDHHHGGSRTSLIELPLSVQGQVQQLIEDATSEDNLSQMYIGWMPWL